MITELQTLFKISDQDVALIWLSTAASCFSSLAGAWYRDTVEKKHIPPALETIPKHQEEVKVKQTKSNIQARGYWTLGALFSGALIGFAIALYFMGVIQANSHSLGKVLLLSLVAGFYSPKILDKIENKVLEQITN